MLYRNLAFSLLFCCAMQSQAQEKNQASLVKWDAGNKITWEHFMVKDTSDRFAAELVTFFKANFFLKEDSVFCQVISFLDPAQSWRKPEIVDNPYAINHEQMHFNITEVFARRIRKELIHSNLNEQQLEKIYHEHSKACYAFQKQYDAETRHSLDVVMQERWNKKINSLLATLEPYKEKAIYIKDPWCKLCWKDRSMITGNETSQQSRRAVKK